MTNHELHKEPAYHARQLAARDCSALAQVQAYPMGFYYKSLCQLILGQAPQKKGQRQDQRKCRIPESLKEGLKAILFMFCVDPETLERKYNQELFQDDVWRETSYAEIAQIRSGGSLTRHGIIFMLKMLEKAGIIERFRKFCAATNTSVLFLRLNATRLLELLRGIRLPGYAQRMVAKMMGKKVETLFPANPCEQDANHTLSKPDERTIYSHIVPPASPVPVPAASAPGITSLKEDSQDLATASPLPGPVGSLSEPEQAWRVFQSIFPEAAREAHFKGLVRRLKHPVPEHRLTLAELELYGQGHGQSAGQGLWYYNVDPAMFLKSWSRLRRIVHSEAHCNDVTCALDYLAKLRRVEADLVYTRKEMAQRLEGWETFHPRRTLEESVLVYGLPVEDYPMQILVQAQIAKLDVLAKVRPLFQRWARNNPAYFMRLRPLLPVLQWAGFNVTELAAITRLAEQEYGLACKRVALGRQYACEEVSHGGFVLNSVYA